MEGEKHVPMYGSQSPTCEEEIRVANHLGKTKRWCWCIRMLEPYGEANLWPYRLQARSLSILDRTGDQPPVEVSGFKVPLSSVYLILLLFMGGFFLFCGWDTGW